MDQRGSKEHPVLKNKNLKNLLQLARGKIEENRQ
jgi:hypothetical protein